MPVYRSFTACKSALIIPRRVATVEWSSSNQGFADVAFAGLVRRHAAVGEDKPGETIGREVMDEMLHPGEVGVAFGRRAVLPAHVIVGAVPVGIVEGRIGDDELRLQVFVQIAAKGVGVFGALKSRGFNLEDTHLKEPERVSRLQALLALAFTLAFLVGQWQATVKELKLKKHGYKPKSVFRLGLNLLCRLVTNLESFGLVAWRKIIKLLSCS